MFTSETAVFCQSILMCSWYTRQSECQAFIIWLRNVIQVDWTQRVFAHRFIAGDIIVVFFMVVIIYSKMANFLNDKVNQTSGVVNRNEWESTYRLYTCIIWVRRMLARLSGQHSIFQRRKVLVAHDCRTWELFRLCLHWRDIIMENSRQNPTIILGILNLHNTAFGGCKIFLITYLVNCKHGN